MPNSNLPPGVTSSMIPGNRPEDAAMEAAEEILLEAMAQAGAHPSEYHALAMLVPGWIEAMRKWVDLQVKEQTAELRLAADMAQGAIEDAQSDLKEARDTIGGLRETIECLQRQLLDKR